MNNATIRNTARTLCILLTILMLSGCATYHLRNAQNAFRDGAVEEWKALNGQQETGTVYDLAVGDKEPLANYRYALDELDGLLKEDRASLENDGLLGTALTLQTLCLWKLGDEERRGEAAKAAKAAGLTPEQIILVDLSKPLAKADRMYDLYKAAPRIIGFEDYLTIKGELYGSKGVDQMLKAALNGPVVKKNEVLKRTILIYRLTVAANYCRAFGILADDHRKDELAYFKQVGKDSHEPLMDLKSLTGPDSPVFMRMRSLLNSACTCNY
ncbi:hypothetical protein [Salidesulfovibrio brasiliensis]|uniref:hypothetical protein n=1 Tax=Salidesulfovibrio brasiliensis TaxID=221711 RepID=UPI0006CF6E6F|nr:hypothetical protein [Salidesulfovibrio brasiliensis]